MGRDAKLYLRLDELIEEFRVGLIAELELEQRGEQSAYLTRKRKLFRDTGNSFHMASWSTGLESANKLLMLEKEILALCNKMREALPAPLEALNHYTAAIENRVKTSKRYTTEKDDFGSWHVDLRKQAIEKLVHGGK